MNELKKTVKDIMYKTGQGTEIEIEKQFIENFSQEKTINRKDQNYRNIESDENIQDTEIVIEENLSLADKEKELITKALKKHNGKRKPAADELGISERTLYRKLKEYEM